MRSRSTILLLSFLVVAAVVSTVALRGGGGAPAAPALLGALERDVGAPALDEAAQIDANAPADRRAASTKHEESRVAPKQAAQSLEKRESGPALRGRVVDQRGLAVEDAELVVRAADGQRSGITFGRARAGTRATTRADGSFDFPRGGRDAGALSLSVSARGFLLTEETRTPDTESGDGWLGVLELRPGVVIEGLVVDAQGQPVAGASVRRRDEENAGWLADLAELQAQERAKAETDAEGRFTLAHEAPGDYALLVRHEDHPQARFTGTTPPAGGELKNLLLRLPPSATIRGRIAGFPAGREHVRVTAVAADEPQNPMGIALGGLLDMTGGGAKRAVIDAEGAFEVRGLAPGERYRVQALESSGFIEPVRCTDEALAVPGGEPILLTWEPGASVVFEVRDSATGELLADVTVRHRWSTAASRWGGFTKDQAFAEGRVALTELRPNPVPGTLECSVSAPGHLEQRVTAPNVAATGVVDLGVVHLRAAPRVRVRVVDAGTGEPIHAARVSLRPDGENTQADERANAMFSLDAAPARNRTDREGWCELDACSTPTATLVVQKPRYARYEFAGLTMPLEGALEQVVQLSRGGTITVRVIDGAGEPVPGASVITREGDGRVQTRSADAKGRMELTGLIPGRYELRAERSRGQIGVSVQWDRGGRQESAGPSWTTVVVSEGMTAELQLELPALALVAGSVTTRRGPVSGAKVRFLQGELEREREDLQAMLAALGAFAPGAASSTGTDERGDYRLRDVPVGRHRLSVTPAHGSLPQIVAVDLREGENRVDIVLPSASVEGRVVDAAGRPIANASVVASRAASTEAALAVRQGRGLARSLFGGAGPTGATTDAAGRFQIAPVPIDTPFTLEASARGYSSTRSPELSVADDEVLRGVELVLGGAGSLRVVVRGEPQAFRPVTASYEGEPATGPVVELLRDNEIVLRDLRPGPWRVALGTSPGEGQLVEVRAGQERLVELDG